MEDPSNKDTFLDRNFWRLCEDEEFLYGIPLTESFDSATESQSTATVDVNNHFADVTDTMEMHLDRPALRGFAQQQVYRDADHEGQRGAYY